MARNAEIRKIALIGDYLPRKCGIATFTHDLRQSVATQYPATECIVVPVNDSRPDIVDTGPSEIATSLTSWQETRTSV